MHNPLHSVYSVLSVVRRNFNHGLHRRHGGGAAALSNHIHTPLHSVYSVLSVVRRFFNHGLHGMHGLGKGAAALIDEINGELVA